MGQKAPPHKGPSVRFSSMATSHGLTSDDRPMSRRAFDGFASLELGAELRSFRGRALLGGISRSGKPGPRTLALAEHVRSVGASCDVQTVQDRSAGEFGRFHYRTDPTTLILYDTLRPIADAIADRTVAWALATFAADLDGSGSDEGAAAEHRQDVAAGNIA